MARIGYSRVSTTDQHPEAQELRLKAEGKCSKVYRDKGQSGSKASRPEWDKCLARLEPGDVLVVTKLDRMGRSVRNLIDVISALKELGVSLVILDANIDTTTAMGECFFHIMAAFAQFERSVIIERTMDGLANARAEGRVPTGRKREYTDTQADQAKRLKSEGAKADTIAETLRVSRATVYRMLQS